MKNRNVFKEISRLRTTDLLISKMDNIESIALYGSIKRGMIGLMGIFVTQVANAIYTDNTLVASDYLSLVATMICVIEYVILDSLVARSTAQNELIDDLLAIRMNRAGK